MAVPPMPRTLPGGALIRPIDPRDDADVAGIIRTVMPEFGACGAGFAIQDAEVDAMSASYARPRSVYYVLEVPSEGGGTRLVGGGGVAPLEGGDAGTCELRKMYFLSEARGRGWGSALLSTCIDAARGFGFERCYLETLTGMDAAQALYARAGFERIPGSMGATGHFGCDRYFLLRLTPAPSTSAGGPR